MLEQLKDRINNIKGRLEYLKGYLCVDKKLKEIVDLEAAMSAPDFWQKTQKANQIISRLKGLKVVVEPLQKSLREYQSLEELISLFDDKDEDTQTEIEKEISKVEEEVSELELKSLLSGEHDRNNTILSINAGAGGTESCDWVSMLLRMYTRWANRMRYDVQTIDILAGEEAGIKNVTLIIKGEWSYGYLKGESGVHRLVRISPFDANKRRHTSFASVDVIPEIEEDIEIKIVEKDIRVDVFRSSGPGGQGVNTTDSAVRITHIPTGIVVQCQNERSQLKNKATAMKILRSRLYERQQRRQQEKLQKMYAAKQKIEWGSQIRSYIFHPYNMVKDHRTNEETSNTQAVMDGDIDRFMQAYLKQKKI